MDKSEATDLVTQVVTNAIDEGISLEELQERIKKQFDEKVGERVAWEIGNGTL